MSHIVEYLPIMVGLIRGVFWGFVDEIATLSEFAVSIIEESITLFGFVLGVHEIVFF